MEEGELVAICLITGAVGLLIASLEGDPSLVLVGSLIGVLTGLIPGLHINLFIPFVGGMTSLVVGLVISHSFFDFVPAILIGAPDESSSLSVLPSHKMLLKGRALEAFRLTIAGGLLSGIVAITMIPLLGFAREIHWLVPVVLALSLAIMLNSTRQKLATQLIMAASALLGLAAFKTSYGIPAILSGFFGVATIIFSLSGRSTIPPQLPYAEISISKRHVLLGAIAGWLAGLFPGISSSVAAAMVSPRMRHKEFLALLGGTNTVYAFAAIMAIAIIGKPRSGAAIALAPSHPKLLFLVGLSLSALAFSAFLAWMLSRTIVTSFSKINYRLASLAALAVVLLLNSFNGLASLVLMAAASIVGLAALQSGARRSACMASLIIPVLLYYLA